MPNARHADNPALVKFFCAPSLRSLGEPEAPALQNGIHFCVLENFM